MIKTHAYSLIKHAHQCLCGIEHYFCQKSLAEKMILFILCHASVLVPVYFYLIPFMQAEANHWNYLAHHKNASIQSQRAKDKALQESKEQDSMLEELRTQIQSSYLPLESLMQTWQDIITETSTLLLHTNQEPQNLQIHKDNEQISISGTSSLPDFLQALNALECHIPLLLITHINLTPSKDLFSYSIQMQRISPPSPMPDSKSILLTYLNSKTFTPKTTPKLPAIDSTTKNSPENTTESTLTLQATINSRIKINDQWLKVNESIQGFTFMGLKACGAVLQSAHKQLCLPLSKAIPQ